MRSCARAVVVSRVGTCLVCGSLFTRFERGACVRLYCSNKCQDKIENERSAQRLRERYASAKKQGICARCLKVAAPRGYVYCTACKRRQNKLTRHRAWVLRLPRLDRQQSRIDHLKLKSKKEALRILHSSGKQFSEWVKSGLIKPYYVGTLKRPYYLLYTLIRLSERRTPIVCAKCGHVWTPYINARKQQCRVCHHEVGKAIRSSRGVGAMLQW